MFVKDKKKTVICQSGICVRNCVQEKKLVSIFCRSEVFDDDRTTKKRLFKSKFILPTGQPETPTPSRIFIAN